MTGLLVKQEKHGKKILAREGGLNRGEKKEANGMNLSEEGGSLLLGLFSPGKYQLHRTRRSNDG